MQRSRTAAVPQLIIPFCPCFTLLLPPTFPHNKRLPHNYEYLENDLIQAGRVHRARGSVLNSGAKPPCCISIGFFILLYFQWLSSAFSSINKVSITVTFDVVLIIFFHFSLLNNFCTFEHERVRLLIFHVSEQTTRRRARRAGGQGCQRSERSACRRQQHARIKNTGSRSRWKLCIIIIIFPSLPGLSQVFFRHSDARA